MLSTKNRDPGSTTGDVAVVLMKNRVATGSRRVDGALPTGCLLRSMNIYRRKTAKIFFEKTRTFW